MKILLAQNPEFPQTCTRPSPLAGFALTTHGWF